MSGPGHDFWPGLRVSIRAAFLFLPPWRPIGSWEKAALSFAYKHWDIKNRFAKIEPPLHKEPQIRYLLLSEIRRLLDYLKSGRQGYGSPSRSTWPTLSSRRPAGSRS